VKLLHRFYDLHTGGGEVVVSRIVDAFPEHEHLLVFNNYRQSWLSAKLASQPNVRLTQVQGTSVSALIRQHSPDVLFFHCYPPMGPADFEDLSIEVRSRSVIYSHWFRDVPLVDGVARYCFPSAFAAASGPKIPEAMKVTIVNPVSDDFFKVSRYPGRPFTVGRHSRDDGIKFSEDFAAIYEQIEVPDLQVAVLGCPQPLAQTLAASLHHAQHNYWLLPLNTMDVRKFLRFVDVYVYKTHHTFAETCPLCILEALASGIPVVGEDKGGISNLVVHAHSGFLCRELSEFKSGVESLYGDPLMLAQFSEFARQWAFENASGACFRAKLSREFSL
jgi:glycosyltransferase involved in cell wall biosynthesis